MNLMVLPEEEVEAEIQVILSQTLLPPGYSRSFSWVVASYESHTLPPIGWGG